MHIRQWTKHLQKQGGGRESVGTSPGAQWQLMHCPMLPPLAHFLFGTCQPAALHASSSPSSIIIIIIIIFFFIITVSLCFRAPQWLEKLVTKKR